jgi:PhzF family phenazine biosynthesis protein
MLNIPIYQVDAFANRVFEGNPAAVCPLENWLPDATIQSIAAENNLAETAFVVPEGESFRIRWFTPRHEAPLCGHATLATAFVLLHVIGVEAKALHFQSRSGPLVVQQDGDWLVMDFPAYEMQPVEAPADILAAFAIPPTHVFRTLEDPNYNLIYEQAEQVRAMQPNLAQLEQWPHDGFAVSAPDDHFDCVSRYFAPGAGIPEDPVTGSIHSALVPYWSQVLGKNTIHAYQASARGGELHCEYHPDRQRVTIRGKAALYMQGTISLPDSYS